MLRDPHRKKETVSIDDMGESTTVEENGKEDEVIIKDTYSSKNRRYKTEIRKPDIKLVGKTDLENL